MARPRPKRVVSPTSTSNYRNPNPRGCPGSFARVRRDENGRGVCPFCYNDKKVRKDGMLSAHVRRP